MATSEIHVKVKADGVGLQTIEHQAKSLAGILNKLGNGPGSEILKGIGEVAGAAGPFAAVAGVVGIEAAMAKHLTEWADEMQEVSETFGISTTAAQNFSFAAELAGKDMGFLTNEIERSSEFAEKALSTNDKYKKERQFAQTIGLSDLDLKDLAPEQLMKEIVKRAKELKLSDTDLDTVFGKRKGREVSHVVEQLEFAEKYTMTLSPEMIEQLADAWKEMKVILQNVFVVVKALGSQFLMLHKILLDVATFNFRENGVETLWKDIKAVFNPLQMPGAGEGDNNANRLAAMEGNKELSNLKDTPFLAMGGLLGTDTTFRLERLQEKANSYLEQIARNTARRETASLPVASALAQFSGGGNGLAGGMSNTAPLSNSHTPLTTTQLHMGGL